MSVALQEECVEWDKYIDMTILGQYRLPQMVMEGNGDLPRKENIDEKRKEPIMEAWSDPTWQDEDESTTETEKEQTR